MWIVKINRHTYEFKNITEAIAFAKYWNVNIE